MLKKVGVYALIRVFTLLFTNDVGWTHQILLWLSGLTMLTGVLGAAAQNEFRKILSFHIISQIGYMIMGLALYTPLALAGAVFYLVHHIIVKANLFFVAGLARRVGGSFRLAELGGLYRAHPLLAILFLIPAFSLAGFPPLSGFWAKLVVVLAAVEVGSWAIVAVALVVGLLTIYSMTKIWQAAFWSPVPEGRTVGAMPSWLLIAPVAALAMITVVIGLWSGPFLALAQASADELLEPARYVGAVLGDASALRYLEGRP